MNSTSVKTQTFSICIQPNSLFKYTPFDSICKHIHTRNDHPIFINVSLTPLHAKACQYWCLLLLQYIVICFSVSPKCIPISKWVKNSCLKRQHNVCNSIQVGNMLKNDARVDGSTVWIRMNGIFTYPKWELTLTYQKDFHWITVKVFFLHQ